MPPVGHEQMQPFDTKMLNKNTLQKIRKTTNNMLPVELLSSSSSAVVLPVYNRIKMVQCKVLTDYTFEHGPPFRKIKLFLHI